MAAVSGRGQTFTGLVVDHETTKPMQGTSVTNHTTGQSVLIDHTGFFSVPAKTGDSISFLYTGYYSVIRTATPGDMVVVELRPLSVRLEEHVVHELTPFQRDSIEMTLLYAKELNTKPIRTGYSSANGGGFTGLIGGPIQKLTRSYKKNKRFKETFKSDMEQKFVATRYTPKLVNTITGFTGDSLAIFMNTYPMEYTFARTATDLEVKVWIRDNYKEYLKPRPKKTEKSRR
jgi:hypothetical protein